MKRVFFFGIAGFDIGCVLLDLVALMHQADTSAPMGAAARTMLWIVALTACAGVMIGMGLEADR